MIGPRRGNKRREPAYYPQRDWSMPAGAIDPSRHVVVRSVPVDSMASSDRLPENQMFGRYRIVRLLGEGGMGAVYEAIHPILKKRVAIKILLPSLAAQSDARARFLREGEAASRINH